MKRQAITITIAAMFGVLGAAGPMAAQGIVITGASSAQYIQLQPMTLDSVPYASTDSAYGVYRRTSSGILARCDAANLYCSYLRSTPTSSLLAMTQDLNLTGWGFGQGLSVHADLRARDAAGDARDLWPQAAQRLDVLEAYAELERPSARARLGRQWIQSALGVFNFDGASALWRYSDQISAQAYGGLALVQGLNQEVGPGALAPVEDLPPDVGSYLLGVIGQFRPTTLTSLRLQYQREIRRDRAGLYSERFAANGEWLAGGGTWSGELTRDLATNQFNTLSLSYRRPLVFSTVVRAEIRRYVPFFDLWTIWGAFSPVGYTEGTLSVDWASSDSRLLLGASGGRRSYDNTNTGVGFLPLRTDGWRAGGTGAYRLAPSWLLQGSYDADIDFGASSSDEDLALRWSRGDDLSLGLHALAFQNIYEFQIGSGQVIGGGAEAAFRLSPDVRFVGDLLLYHHTGGDTPQLVNWDQKRATMRLEWALGGATTSGRIP
jgi:hypothetical protein